MRKVRTYKGWTIYQGTEQSADGINHVIYRCYLPGESPNKLDSSEWDAVNMQEALDFIDSY